MSQLFSKRADTFFKVVLGAIILTVVGFFPFRSLVENSSYATYINVPINQPIPFSHKHHVGDVGINCRYCHTSVEKSSYAGMPPTETCNGCHSKLWKDAPLLAPVRSSLATGIPIQWNRVNNIPDYVFFNHSIHISKGVGCQSCHGKINQMPEVYKVNAFHMEDCLECHRNPERFIRPKENIYDFGWKAENQRELGEELIKKYQIHTKHLTECITCHR